VQEIDAEIKTKISDIHCAVSEVRDSVRTGGVAGQLLIEIQLRFEIARDKAERVSGMGRPAEASHLLMEALELEVQLERERQEDHKQLRLRYYEGALVFDLKAGCPEAAADKVLQIAEIMHLDDRKARNGYARRRALKYHEIGRTQGDNSANLIAFEILKRVTEDNG
jgi:hypothetical protein